MLNTNSDANIMESNEKTNKIMKKITFLLKKSLY